MNKDSLSTKNKIHLRTLVLLKMLTFTFRSVLGATIFALIIQCLTIFIGYLSSKNQKFIQNFNNNTISSVSKKYTVYLTPANWAFGIWGIIYVFQLAWITYILVYRLLFKKKLLYRINSMPIYLFSFGNILSIIWTFLWLREKIVYCFLDMLFMTKTLHISYTLISKSVDISEKSSQIVILLSI